MAKELLPSAYEAAARRSQGDQISNANAGKYTPTEYLSQARLLKNIYANRLAISKSKFGRPGIIKGQATPKTRKIIVYGSPYDPPFLTRYERRRQFEIEKAARNIVPQYDKSLLPAVIKNPVNFFPYRKYDFVGKDKTTYDTNWAYRQAKSSPTGMDFFAPVTSEQAEAMRTEDAENKQRRENRYEYLRRQAKRRREETNERRHNKWQYLRRQAKRRREETNERRHNKWQYLRRQATRRREIFDDYKWLKQIAKASPTIAKHLPKIAKVLDKGSKIPVVGSIVKHPYLSLLGLAIAGQKSKLRAARGINQRRILEGFYGTTSERDMTSLFTSGMGYEESLQSSGRWKALAAQIQVGMGTGILQQAAALGLPELAVLTDPLIPYDEKKRIIAKGAQRLPEGKRIAALQIAGMTPKEYSASLMHGKPIEDYTSEQLQDLYGGKADKWLGEKAAKSRLWALIRGIGIGDFFARDIAIGDYGATQWQKKHGKGVASGWKDVLGEIFSFDSKLPLAHEAAQSLNDSNIRASDANVAAMMNYGLSERPVTVVIQGDIRTDADNGQKLFDDIEKTYGVGFLTNIAQPVAKSFDSKIKR